MTDIKPGDRFRLAGTAHKDIRYRALVQRPTRTYTVQEPWGIDWRCSVDPPMSDGSRVAVVSVARLLRFEKLEPWG